jgi:hypothetical protein
MLIICTLTGLGVGSWFEEAEPQGRHLRWYSPWHAAASSYTLRESRRAMSLNGGQAGAILLPYEHLDLPPRYVKAQASNG